MSNTSQCRIAQAARWLVAVLVASCFGCATRVYVVDLEATEAGLQRSLTVFEQDNERTLIELFDEEEPHRFHQAYPDGRIIKRDNGYQFRGIFDETMPQDIGGFGKFHRYDSPMGKAYVYAERFGGNANLAKLLDERNAAVDRIVELAAQWLPGQIEDPEVAAIADKWIKGTGKDDAHALLLYAWTLSATESFVSTAEGDAPWRHIASFLLEHDYVRLEHLPELALLNHNEDVDANMRYVVGVMKRKWHLDDDQAKAIQFLTNRENY